MSTCSAAMAKQRHYLSHDQPGSGLVWEQILPKADEKVFFCYQDSFRKQPQSKCCCTWPEQSSSSLEAFCSFSQASGRPFVSMEMCPLHLLLPMLEVRTIKCVPAQSTRVRFLCHVAQVHENERETKTWIHVKNLHEHKILLLSTKTFCNPS